MIGNDDRGGAWTRALLGMASHIPVPPMLYRGRSGEKFSHFVYHL